MESRSSGIQKCASCGKTYFVDENKTKGYCLGCYRKLKKNKKRIASIVNDEEEENY